VILLKCVFCLGDDISSLDHQFFKQRNFYHCQTCDVIFVDPNDFWSAEKDKVRYASHQNNLEDLKYVEHLDKILLPIENRIKNKDSRGLDFGCGPSRAAESLLKQRGYTQITSYDLHFFSEPVPENDSFDFIIANEVVEHFRSPRQDWLQLISLLRKGGLLAFATQLHQHGVSNEHFQNWWYVRDHTHVIFYSEKTWHWLVENINGKLDLGERLTYEKISDSVFFFTLDGS
jgi:SAM-dependent methyltransferase